jgi:hypothetical protein
MTHSVCHGALCTHLGFPALFTSDAVQRLFRYLKHTPEFGIWYSTSSSLDLVGFFEADFVNCGSD